MLRAAARARRKSRWDASSSRWSPVYEWVVVMVPLTMPNFSDSTCTKQAYGPLRHALCQYMAG